MLFTIDSGLINWTNVSSSTKSFAIQTPILPKTSASSSFNFFMFRYVYSINPYLEFGSYVINNSIRGDIGHEITH